MSVVATGNRRRRQTKYFFWDDKLHKVLRINYPQNLVDAWCFSERRSVSLLYTDFKRNAGKALSPKEVRGLMKCNQSTITRAILNGEIHPPEPSYALNGDFKTTKHWWSEKMVIELHEALLSHHIGRPTKDGRITPKSTLPTRAQVRAYFRNEQTLYIRADDGRMIPVFDSPQW